MTKLYLFVFGVMVVLSQQRVAVQDLKGAWQGVLRANNQNQRTVIKILKDDGGTLQGALYSIDKGPGYYALTGTARGGNITLSVQALVATYTGKLDSNGDSISGTWAQDGSTQSLNLLRAKPETAWTIPDDRVPKMPTDVDLTYEVATIKPSRPEEGRSLMRQGKRFITTATSIVDLMMFAYGVHSKQIANVAGWLETDKYDVTLLQAGEGQPSDAQLKGMVSKVLSDRVRLTIHHEKRDLSVFRIVTLKAGTKLVDSVNPDGPAVWGGGGRVGMMIVKSATIANFAGFIQRYFDIGQPVIDSTGLSRKYDFTLRWTPDDRRNTGGAPDEFPDLFTAIEQQLGLKLETVTQPIDVLVIDHAERPTEN
jgi:uncharacterized protein (TIGR03435 family)